MSGRKKQLTDEQVREIRQLYNHKGSKWTYKKIGEKYGVSLGTIAFLINGRTYKGVK